MKHIHAVYNLKTHTSIVISDDAGNEETHLFDTSTRAARFIFRTLITYLESRPRDGFFNVTTGGWFWLCYTVTE